MADHPPVHFDDLERAQQAEARTATLDQRLAWVEEVVEFAAAVRRGIQPPPDPSRP